MTWFNSPERIAALRAAAEIWVGTPFAPNAEEPGRGVSCQKLVGALYRASGFPMPPVPDGPMSHDRFHLSSLITAWVAGHAAFFEEVADRPPVFGDLLGFRIKNEVHHSGIAFGDGLFFSVTHHPAGLRSLADPGWSGRLLKVWRPREDAQ